MRTKAALDPVPLRLWREYYGPLPADYLAVDVETSGVDPAADRILQLGWCLVKGGKAIRSGAAVVDWAAELPRAELAALASRMETARASMFKKNKAYPWTLEVLRARGKPPRQVAARLAALSAGVPLVAHYGYLLDYKLLEAFQDAFGPAPFAHDYPQLFDTGLLTKAALLGLCPRAAEPLHAFLSRVDRQRGAARHNLDTCATLYKLHDGGVVTAAMHAHADYDAWVSHLVFERLRALTEPLT